MSGNPASVEKGKARRIIVLGSTGSVGQQALEVIEHLCSEGSAFEVVGLAAGKNGRLLLEQAKRLGVRDTAIACGPIDGVTRCGPDSAERLVREVEADVVVAAIVGVAGLRATFAAVELGRDVALANKESLVAAGSLMVPLARSKGVQLLPVDSEHAAMWLCLSSVLGGAVPPCEVPGCVSRAVLTASGGPFRTLTREGLLVVTADEALAHPTWTMGSKITIDSATLMNKAFECIEAHWLFGLEPARLGVIVHPQSIVHAMIEFEDGSVLAQMGAPDMRTPIQQALTSPSRVDGVSNKLDLETIGSLSFEAGDAERFPALELWREVIEKGGNAGAVVNGANEVAVGAFLDGHAGFCDIERVARGALDAVGTSAIRDLADVFDADREARRFAAMEIGLSDARESSVG